MIRYQKSRTRHIAILLALLVAGLGTILSVGTSTGAAQEYSFSTDEEYVTVHVQKDGSVDIDYMINFTNYGYLDGIDIGCPNEYYDLTTAWAEIEIDGAKYAPLELRESPYVEIGVAVEFTSATMDALSTSGTPFTLRFHINNPHMVYENELVEGGAGIRFRPTWFDADFQQGDTGLLVASIYFPEGFDNASAAVYLENQPWTSFGLEPSSGLYLAQWIAYGVSSGELSSGDYDVGVGFPAAYVDRYYTEPATDVFGDLLGSLGELCITLFPVIIVAVIVGLTAWASARSKKKRATDYFEPKLSLAGAGPRRDLTAVEAAIALERPLDMVATMVLFGLIKKDKVKVLSEDFPMRLSKIQTRGDFPYEDNYLMAIDRDGRMDREGLKRTLVVLIKATQSKLEGFDYEATKQYYETICEAAWKQVQQAGTPEDFARVLNERNEWMMLDNGYGGRMERIWIGHPVLYPSGQKATTQTTPQTASQAGRGVQDMARDYASKVKRASDNLVRDTRSLSREIAGKTNPLPPSAPAGSRYLSGGGFGGGGGGCACACACACAGGGR